MDRALAWLEAAGVRRTILGIGEGNESVAAFYRRFGFEVRTTVMERLPRQRGWPVYFKARS